MFSEWKEQRRNSCVCMQVSKCIGGSALPSFSPYQSEWLEGTKHWDNGQVSALESCKSFVTLPLIWPHDKRANDRQDAEAETWTRTRSSSLWLQEDINSEGLAHWLTRHRSFLSYSPSLATELYYLLNISNSKRRIVRIFILPSHCLDVTFIYIKHILRTCEGFYRQI